MPEGYDKSYQSQKTYTKVAYISDLDYFVAGYDGKAYSVRKSRTIHFMEAYKFNSTMPHIFIETLISDLTVVTFRVNSVVYLDYWTGERPPLSYEWNGNKPSNSYSDLTKIKLGTEVVIDVRVRADYTESAFQSTGTIPDTPTAQFEALLTLF